MGEFSFNEKTLRNVINSYEAISLANKGQIRNYSVGHAWWYWNIDQKIYEPMGEEEAPTFPEGRWIFAGETSNGRIVRHGFAK